MTHRRATTRRRAKRAMWLALGLFFLGQAVLGYLLDYRFPVVRFPSVGTTAQRAATQSPPPAVVFLGSSRTMTGVMVPEADRVLRDAFGPDNPPRTFNAGVVAGDVISSEFVLDQLLARGVRPRWVVLEVSPETLGARQPFVGEHVVRQYTWAHAKELPTMMRANSALPYLEARFAPIYTHRKELVRLAKLQGREILGARKDPPPPGQPAPAEKTPRPDEGEGAAEIMPQIAPITGEPGEEERLLAQSRAGASRVVRRWLRNYRIGGPAPPALKRILARCRDEGIDITLLGIPACSAHRQELTIEMLADYYGYMDDLVQEYQCRFVDAIDWVPDLQFGDTLHIRSETGGIAFTARFTREILVPLIRQDAGNGVRER